MKASSILSLIISLFFISLTFSGCDFDEVCDATEAPMVTIGDFSIDAYEASRSNATQDTMGTGVTLACNYKNSVPWSNVTYEDAKNACLDAGKRLCTKEEWLSACGAEGAYPYGDSYQKGTCNDGGVESDPTGKSGCKSAKNVYDLSGNLREWVEGGSLMGGSYLSSTPEELACSAKAVADPLSFSNITDVGFRCCKDLSTL